jgi:hypothetical protein
LSLQLLLTLPSPLPLPLPLQVPAVILTLSEVEWGRTPKNFAHPNRQDISTHTLKRPFPILLPTT